MIKRILLVDIEAKFCNQQNSQLNCKWIHHPIGLMYLASVGQKQFPDITFNIFHTATADNPLEKLRSLITDFKPDLIGLRSLSIAREYFLEIANLIHESKPNIPLVAGGPFPSSSYRDLLTSRIVDLVVIGEGEKTFISLIRHYMDNGCLPSDLPGTVVQKDNSQVIVNSPQVLIEELDTIPFPNYDLIDLSKYADYSNHAFMDSSNSAFIYTSRGCPYSCFYCHNLSGKQVRRRSAENVLLEMREHINKCGIRDFVFVDDIFNVPMKAGKEILSLIIRELKNVRLNFPNGLRADQLDDEFIDLLEEAGTCQMSIAVETASPRLQKIVGKNLNLERAKKAIQVVSERFIVFCFFMIGFPTETMEETMETIRFAQDLDCITSPTLSIVRLYKGTALYEMLNPSEEQSKAIENQEQQMFTPKLTDFPWFYGDLFSREKVPLQNQDIRKLRWEWMRSVFNNPSRIANSHNVVQKHFNHEQMIQLYRNLYDNPNFDDSNLKVLLGTNTK